MRILKMALAAGACALAMTGAAHADDSLFKIAVNLGAATDYEFRGVSNTNHKPEVFAGADATIGKIGYVGTWLSNVDFGNGTDAEIDLYGGVRPTLGPVSLDLGAIYYGYINKPSGPDEAYWEVKALATVPVGPATLGASIYYSPEFQFKAGNATYIEANAAVPIPNSKFSLSGAVGRQYVKGPADYTTWNLGVGYAVNDHVGLDLRYWDTDKHSLGKLYGGRAVASVKVTF